MKKKPSDGAVNPGINDAREHAPGNTAKFSQEEIAALVFKVSEVLKCLGVHADKLAALEGLLRRAGLS